MAVGRDYYQRELNLRGAHGFLELENMKWESQQGPLLMFFPR